MKVEISFLLSFAAFSKLGFKRINVGVLTQGDLHTHTQIRIIPSYLPLTATEKSLWILNDRHPKWQGAAHISTENGWVEACSSGASDEGEHCRSGTAEYPHISCFPTFYCLSQQFSLRSWRKLDVGECCGRLNNGHLKISSPIPIIYKLSYLRKNNS